MIGGIASNAYAYGPRYGGYYGGVRAGLLRRTVGYYGGGYAPGYGYAPAYYGRYSLKPTTPRPITPGALIRPAYAYYGGPRYYGARYYGGGPRYYRAYRRW